MISFNAISTHARVYLWLLCCCCSFFFCCWLTKYVEQQEIFVWWINHSIGFKRCHWTAARTLARHTTIFFYYYSTRCQFVFIKKMKRKEMGKSHFFLPALNSIMGADLLSHTLSLSVLHTQTVMKSLCNRICRISASNGAPAAPHPSIRTFRIFFISSSLSLSHSSTPPLVHCLCLSDEPLEAKTYISDKHTKFKQKCSSDVRTVNVKPVFCWCPFAYLNSI